MHCKALDLVDGSHEKMYSTTSIAMDWQHKHLRLRQSQRQLLFKHLYPHQSLRQLQLQLLLQRLRPHLLRLLRPAPQLHRVIVSKWYRCQKFVDSQERTW
jgi:hypothetical protein